MQNISKIKELILGLNNNPKLSDFIQTNNIEIKFNFEDDFKSIFHTYKLRYNRWKKAQLDIPEGLEGIIANLTSQQEKLENDKLNIFCIGNENISYLLFIDSELKTLFGAMVFSS